MPDNEFYGRIMDLVEAGKVTDDEIVTAFAGLVEPPQVTGTATERVAQIREKYTERQIAEVLAGCFKF